MNIVTRGVFAAALGLAVATSAQAQTYPTKPVTIVMPFLAGGAVDILARIHAVKLTEYWGQQVVVENRVGAGGNVGSAYVANAAPDGHTLLIAPQGPLSYNKALYSDMAYDPATAFAPILMVARSPNFLSVPKDSKVTSPADLVALAKAQPGNVFYGSPGNGTTPHLTGGMFALRTGTNMVHVPYRGSPPIFADLQAGRLTFTFADSGNTLPRAKDDLLKVLAIASNARWPSMPNVPTMAEAGFPNFEAVVWYGLAAPAKTPRAVIDKIRDGMIRAGKEPDSLKRLADLGVEMVGSTPEDMGRILADETRKWAEVIKQTGAKPD